MSIFEKLSNLGRGPQEPLKYFSRKPALKAANQRRKLDELRLLLHIRHGVSDKEPDIYWDQDRLGKIYDDVREHLEVDNRIKRFDQNCQLLMESYDRHYETQSGNYALNLEWIIIGLIFLEVVYSAHCLVVYFTEEKPRRSMRQHMPSEIESEIES